MSLEEEDVYDKLTRYERCQIISHRSKEISSGAKVHLDRQAIRLVGNDPIKIATKEFERRLIDICIERADSKVIDIQPIKKNEIQETITISENTGLQSSFARKTLHLSP